MFNKWRPFFCHLKLEIALIFSAEKKYTFLLSLPILNIIMLLSYGYRLHYVRSLFRLQCFLILKEQLNS